MRIKKIINAEEVLISTSQTPEVNEKTSSGKVDINHLLAKVRNKEQEKNKVNMIFFAMFALLILIIGILLSL